MKEGPKISAPLKQAQDVYAVAGLLLAIRILGRVGAMVSVVIALLASHFRSGPPIAFGAGLGFEMHAREDMSPRLLSGTCSDEFNYDLSCSRILSSPHGSTAQLCVRAASRDADTGPEFSPAVTTTVSTCAFNAFPRATKGAIWSSTKKLSSVENALAHFTKHGSEFPGRSECNTSRLPGGSRAHRLPVRLRRCGAMET